MSENKLSWGVIIGIITIILGVIAIVAEFVVPEVREAVGLDSSEKIVTETINSEITPTNIAQLQETSISIESDTQSEIQLPVRVISHEIIQDFGSSQLSLSENEVIVGTADRYQDNLSVNNPPYTIFIVHGPIQTELSLFWGGWDEWANATQEHIDKEIASKIDELILEHAEDYETRGYRVIKCKNDVTNCEVLNTFP